MQRFINPRKLFSVGVKPIFTMTSTIFHTQILLWFSWRKKQSNRRVESNAQSVRELRGKLDSTLESNYRQNRLIINYSSSWCPLLLVDVSITANLLLDPSLHESNKLHNYQMSLLALFSFTANVRALSSAFWSVGSDLFRIAFDCVFTTTLVCFLDRFEKFWFLLFYL